MHGYIQLEIDSISLSLPLSRPLSPTCRLVSFSSTVLDVFVISLNSFFRRDETSVERGGFVFRGEDETQKRISLMSEKRERERDFCCFYSAAGFSKKVPLSLSLSLMHKTLSRSFFNTHALTQTLTHVVAAEVPTKKAKKGEVKK
jgi:hypothetical protein